MSWLEDKKTKAASLGVELVVVEKFCGIGRGCKGLYNRLQEYHFLDGLVLEQRAPGAGFQWSKKVEGGRKGVDMTKKMLARKDEFFRKMRQG